MFKPKFLFRPNDGHGNGGQAASATSTTPGPSPGQQGFDPQIYNPEGQLWKDLYNGTVGGMQSLKTQHTQALATLQGKVDEHKTTIQERDAALTQLRGQNEELASTIAALKEQIETIPGLAQRAGYADRLEILMQFPELVAAQTVREVQGEEGQEPTEVTIRPYLELIATTTLSGNELREHLANMASTIAPTSQAQVSASPPVVPPQPQPKPKGSVSQSLDDLGKKLRTDPNNTSYRKQFMDLLARLPEGRT
jgi:hypothetical protein